MLSPRFLTNQLKLIVAEEEFMGQDTRRFYSLIEMKDKQREQDSWVDEI